MEMEKVPRAGYEIVGLPIRGLDRTKKLANLSFPFRLISSLFKSWSLVKRWQPDVVVGTGGYAGGPVLYAAAKLGVPTLIQEPNAFAGLANKWLGKQVDKVCVAFPGMERFFPAEKIVVTGNPVREEAFVRHLPGWGSEGDARSARGRLSPDPSPQERGASAALPATPASPAKSATPASSASSASPASPASSASPATSPLPRGEGLGERRTILLTGGSGGARSLNEALRDNTAAIAARPDVSWTWQCGKHYYDTFKDCATAQLANVTISAFLDDMPTAYAAADVVIGRAGSTTIAELQFLGKAAILVPSPWVAEDHQTMNARVLTDADAAELVADREASEQLVPTALRLIDDAERRATLGRNARAMAQTGAVTRIAQEILALAGRPLTDSSPATTAA